MDKYITKDYNTMKFIWSLRTKLAKILLGNTSAMINCDLINIDTTVHHRSLIQNCRFLSGKASNIKKVFPKTYEGKWGITLKPRK